MSNNDNQSGVFDPYYTGNMLDSRQLPSYEKWEESGYGDSFYYIYGDGRVSAINAFNEYIFTSFGNHIYYINQNYSRARPLEGTYRPRSWTSNTHYNKGDIVRPTDENYNGYVYECLTNTTNANSPPMSGWNEPEWAKDLSTQIPDGEIIWRGIGSLELEGNSAVDLQTRCLAVYKGFLVTGNNTEDGEYYPSRIRWSQWQNPRLWHNNEDGSGLAGYVDADDVMGAIMNLKVLGDTLYAYKDHSIIGITYTGGEDVTFSKEMVTNKAGLIAQDAIVELPHQHIFVGQDNIYSFDGNTCVPIGDQIKDWFFNFVDKARAYRMFGYYEENKDDAIIAFSSIKNKGRMVGGRPAEDCDYAIIYNVSMHTWSVRELHMTAAGIYNMTKDKTIDEISDEMDSLNDTQIDGTLYAKDSGVFLMGDQEGNFFINKGYADYSDHNTGGAYDAYVVSKTHHMDAPDMVKRLMRVQFHIETQGDYNLYVQIGYGWNAETEQMTWTRKQYLNLKNPVPWYSHHVAPFIDVDLSARYFQIKFGTENKNEPFKILGYTLFYQIRSNE